MMGRIFIPLFILAFLQGAAQAPDPHEFIEYTAGINYRAEKDISAVKHLFPYGISDVDYGADDVIIFCLNWNDVRFKNPGYLIAYDPEERKIKIAREVAYNDQDKAQKEIFTVDGMVFSRDRYKVYGIDGKIKMRLWGMTDTLAHVNKALNIGVGYTFDSKGHSTALVAYDLSNGKKIWSRRIKASGGMDNFQYLKDSVLLASSSGLHKIHLKTGKGWDFPIKTGKYHPEENDGTGMAIVIAFGMIGGIIYATSPDEVYGIKSNTLVHEGKIYFAGRKKLICLNERRKVIWRRKLDKKQSSVSQLFLRNNQLYLVNKGFAFLFGKITRHGTPYIASFSPETGEEFFYASVIDNNKSVVKNITINDKTAYLLFENQLSLYSLENGAEIKSKEFSSIDDGNFIRFLDENVYMKSDKGLNGLALSFPDKYCILTDKDKIVILDDNLDVEEVMYLDDLYIYIFSYGDLRFYRKGRELLAYDPDNRLSAVLHVSHQAVPANGKLYDVKDDALIEVDLSQLIVL